MSRSLGRLAERRAESLLRARGLRLVVRNFVCRFGEIDLVMDDNGTLAIIEVRARGPGSLCNAAESVSRTKQTRIISATRYLLAGRPGLAERPVRFDVVAISESHGDNAITWIRDAFRP